MDAKLISSLQPASQSSIDILSALDRIDAAKVSAVSRADAANAKLATGALTLDSKGRRALQGDAEDASLDQRQCDAMAETLREPLREALEREATDKAASDHTALLARIEAHEAGFLVSYRKHEHALRALLAERKSIVNAAKQHNAATAKFPEFNIGNVDELENAVRETRFFMTAEEHAAEKARFEYERYTAIAAANEERQRRYNDQVAYAASRADPDPFLKPLVRVAQDAPMVTRG